MSFHTPHQQTAPTVLIQRVADELGLAREHLHRVELVLEAALYRPTATGKTAAARPDGGHPDDLAPRAGELQALDLVLQILGDLTVCLERLAQSQGMSQASMVDAREILRPLRLADLQRRLAGLGPHGRPATPMELF